jgi:cytochrome c oxidase cbb3-type subunit 3
MRIAGHIAALAVVFLAETITLAQTQCPKTTTGTLDVAAGKQLFDRHCVVCHGIEGRGGRGPSLNRVELTHAPDDAALRSLIADGIPPAMPAGFFFTDDDLANLSTYVRSLSKLPPESVPGDTGRGARVYAQAGCSICHIVTGIGTGYGPELTDIGIRRSPSYIRLTILHPESTIPEGFLLVEAVAGSGETIQGIRANEDTFTIQIKDTAGRYHSMRKEDLTHLRKLRGQTPMPSFEKVLQGSELQDLVAYLASLRGKK